MHRDSTHALHSRGPLDHSAGAGGGILHRRLCAWLHGSPVWLYAAAWVLLLKYVLSLLGQRERERHIPVGSRRRRRPDLSVRREYFAGRLDYGDAGAGRINRFRGTHTLWVGDNSCKLGIHRPPGDQPELGASQSVTSLGSGLID